MSPLLAHDDLENGNDTQDDDGGTAALVDTDAPNAPPARRRARGARRASEAATTSATATRIQSPLSAAAVPNSLSGEMRKWTAAAPWIAAVAMLVIASVAALVANQVLQQQQLDNLHTTVSLRCDQHMAQLHDTVSWLVDTQISYIRAYLETAPALDHGSLSTFANSLSTFPFARHSVLQRVTAAERKDWEAAINGTIVRARGSLFTDAPAPNFFIEAESWPPAAVDLLLEEALAPPRLVSEPLVSSSNTSVVYWPIVSSVPASPSIAYLNANLGVRQPAVAAVTRDDAEIAATEPFVLSSSVVPPPNNTALRTLIPGWSVFSRPLQRKNGDQYIVTMQLDIQAYAALKLQPAAIGSNSQWTLSIGSVMVSRTHHSTKPVNTAFGVDVTYNNSFTVAGKEVMLHCAPLPALISGFITGAPIVIPALTIVAGIFLSVGSFYIARRMVELWRVETLLDSWKTSAEAILQAMPNAMLLIDTLGRVLGVNEPLLFLTGFSSVEDIGTLDGLMALPATDCRPTHSRAGSPLLGDGIGGREEHHHHHHHQRTRLSHAFTRDVSSSRNSIETVTDFEPASAAPDPQSTMGGALSSWMIDMSADIVTAILSASRLDVRALSKDGQSKPIDMEAGVAPTPDHLSFKHVVVLTDMSDLRERDRALGGQVRESAQLHRTQRALLLYLAHELRNPLYVIQGIFEVIQPELEPALAVALARAIEFTGSVLAYSVECLELEMNAATAAANAATCVAFAADAAVSGGTIVAAAAGATIAKAATTTSLSGPGWVHINPLTPCPQGNKPVDPPVPVACASAAASANPSTSQRPASPTCDNPACIVFSAEVYALVQEVKSLARPRDSRRPIAKLSHWRIAVDPSDPGSVAAARETGMLIGMYFFNDWVPDTAIAAAARPFDWLTKLANCQEETKPPPDHAALARNADGEPAVGTGEGGEEDQYSLPLAVLQLGALVRRTRQVGGTLTFQVDQLRSLQVSVPLVICQPSPRFHGYIMQAR
ncbi:hypothetical protein BC828DRAFT_58723 [Blastocladiella britannica]|nr:hypothetical protein BC828DRAFT_58723 [Blastocladiella britannica]